MAFTYFDMDLYRPTRDCLKLLKNHLTKGSVIVFDELCHEDCPGETAALKEVFGLDAFAIRRTPTSDTASFVVI